MWSGIDIIVDAAFDRYEISYVYVCICINMYVSDIMLVFLAYQFHALAFVVIVDFWLDDLKWTNLCHIDWSDITASVQVQSHSLVNIAIRISERPATAAATNDHMSMMGKMELKRCDGRHGSSRKPMQQYWMRYSCKSQYRSLSKVCTFLLVLWCHWVGDRNGTRPVKNPCHLSTLVLLQNSWRKNEEATG